MAKKAKKKHKKPPKPARDANQSPHKADGSASNSLDQPATSLDGQSNASSELHLDDESPQEQPQQPSNQQPAITHHEAPPPPPKRRSAAWRPAIRPHPQLNSEFPPGHPLYWIQFGYPDLWNQQEYVDTHLMKADSLHKLAMCEAFRAASTPATTRRAKNRGGSSPNGKESSKKRRERVFRVLRALGKNSLLSRFPYGLTFFSSRDQSPHGPDRSKPLLHALWHWTKRKVTRQQTNRQDVRRSKQEFNGNKIFESPIREKLRIGARDIIAMMEDYFYDTVMFYVRPPRPRPKPYPRRKAGFWKRSKGKALHRIPSPEPSSSIRTPEIGPDKQQHPASGPADPTGIQRTTRFNRRRGNEAPLDSWNRQLELEMDIPSSDDYIHFFQGNGKERLSRTDQRQLDDQREKSAEAKLKFLRKLIKANPGDEYLSQQLELAEEASRLRDADSDDESEGKEWSKPTRMHIDTNIVTNPNGEGPVDLVYHNGQLLDRQAATDLPPEDKVTYFSPKVKKLSNAPTLVADSAPPDKTSEQLPVTIPELIIVTDFDGGHDGIQILILPAPVDEPEPLLGKFEVWEESLAATHMDNSIVIPCNTGLVQTFSILVKEFYRFSNSGRPNYDNRIWHKRTLKLRDLIHRMLKVIPDSFLTIPEYSAAIGEFSALENVHHFAKAFQTLFSHAQTVSEMKMQQVEMMAQAHNILTRSLHAMLQLMIDGITAMGNSKEVESLFWPLKERSEEIKPFLDSTLRPALAHQEEQEMAPILHKYLSNMEPFLTKPTKAITRWPAGSSPAAYAPDRFHRISNERKYRCRKLIQIGNSSTSLEHGTRLYCRPGRLLAFEVQLDALASLGVLRTQGGRRGYLRRNVPKLGQAMQRYTPTRPLEEFWIPRPRLHAGQHESGRILHSYRYGVFSWRYPRASLGVLEPISLPFKVKCLPGRAQCNYLEPTVVHEEWRGQAPPGLWTSQQSQGYGYPDLSDPLEAGSEQEAHGALEDGGDGYPDVSYSEEDLSYPEEELSYPEEEFPYPSRVSNEQVTPGSLEDEVIHGSEQVTLGDEYSNIHGEDYSTIQGDNNSIVQGDESEEEAPGSLEDEEYGYPDVSYPSEAGYEQEAPRSLEDQVIHRLEQVTIGEEYSIIQGEEHSNIQDDDDSTIQGDEGTQERSAFLHVDGPAHDDSIMQGDEGLQEPTQSSLSVDGPAEDVYISLDDEWESLPAEELNRDDESGWTVVAAQNKRIPGLARKPLPWETIPWAWRGIGRGAGW
ncbi:hypothetical protein ABW21_db0200704 [Orbilia brochopaga]|nr:hypothetical protein ABW21_db0200704 [Drechslerella brochopaga]